MQIPPHWLIHTFDGNVIRSQTLPLTLFKQEGIELDEIMKIDLNGSIPWASVNFLTGDFSYQGVNFGTFINGEPMVDEDILPYAKRRSYTVINVTRGNDMHQQKDFYFLGWQLKGTDQKRYLVVDDSGKHAWFGSEGVFK